MVKGYTIGSTLTLLKLGVFDAVPATGSITLGDLANTCAVEASLLSQTSTGRACTMNTDGLPARLMRMLTCVGIFEEVKSDVWAHNKLSGPLSCHKSLAGQHLAGRPFYEVV